MRTDSTTRADLVLIGGGHANIQVIKKFAMRPVSGLRVTLISDQVFAPYSGMLPGLLAGWYNFDEAHFDLVRLCDQAGVRLIQDSCVGIDPNNRTIRLATRPPLHYDVASVNVGIIPMTAFSETANHHLSLKPISKLLPAWEGFKKKLADYSNTGKPISIAMVGGGAAGVEICLIICRMLRTAKIKATVTLLEGGKTILSSHSLRAQKLVLDRLRSYSVTVKTSAEIESSPGSELVLKGGSSLGSFDHIFWATRAAPPLWIRQSGLPCNNEGFLQIDRHLRVEGFLNLFGTGDCVQFMDRGLPKSGVYAVRQGPVLAENMRAVFCGRELRTFRPQSRTLALITLGEKNALASYGDFAANGKWLWRIKDYIDRKFMRRWQSLTSMPEPVDSILSSSFPQHPLNTCGGCGAKLPSMALRRILQSPEESTRLRFQDAALLPIRAGESHIQSIDGLKAFDRDLYLFGEISAIHALSDIYARGAVPSSAQCIAQLPDIAGPLIESDLRQLMAGVKAALGRDNVELIGGHTMLAPDVMLGLVVDGSSPSQKLRDKTGLQPDDALILTKSLGTGAVLAAAMKDGRSGHWMQEILPSMLQSHLEAVKVLAGFSVHASTDVTGFGLFGHLLEMLEETDCKVDLHTLPVYSAFRAAIAVQSKASISDSNQAAVDGEIDFKEFCDPVLRAAGYDPQTSGGLLLALPRLEAEECVARLMKAGYTDTTLIGFGSIRKSDEKRIVTIFSGL